MLPEPRGLPLHLAPMAPKAKPAAKQSAKACAGQSAGRPSGAGSESACAAVDPATRAGGQSPAPKHANDSLGEDVLVPAKRARGPAHDVTPPTLVKPTLPKNDSIEEAWSVMKNVIPWVKQALAESTVVGADLKSKKLHECEPLGIKTNIMSDDMASYQAPWDTEQCLKSLRATSLYQAGGNLFWVLASPHGACPAPSLCWSQLRNLQDTFFNPRAEKTKVAKDGRIVFPVILHAYVTEIGQLEFAAGAGETAFALLAGQGLVMAWYVAACDALLQADDRQLAALWQCALTVTLQLRLVCGQKNIMAQSIAVSEAMVVTSRHLTDTFMVFTDKLAKCEVPMEATSLDILRSLGVRFNGATINKTMLAAASLLNKRMPHACRAVLAHIEFGHGRDIFASGYNKIMRIIQIAEKCNEHLQSSVEDSILFFFAAAARMLDEDPKSAAKQFTMEGLDNRRGPGIVTTILGRLWVLEYCSDLVKDLASIEKPPKILAELQGVLQCFASFAAFTKEFPLPSDSGKSESQEVNPDDMSDVDAEDSGETAVERKKKDMSKHAGMMLELCFAACSGLADTELAEVIKGGSLEAMQKMKEDAGGATGASLREVRAALQTHRRIIAVEATSAAPPPSSRTLHRYDSEASESGANSKDELHTERNEVWRNAQAMRKKAAQIGLWSASPSQASTGALQQVFAKSGAVSLRGKATESHRAFVFSADLLAESAVMPWRNLADEALDLPYASSMLDFLQSQAGPFDILICCDGRSRKARRKIEDALASRRHVVETWLIYSGDSKLNQGRRVSFAADNREVIMIALPCPRTSLAVKERASYNACGEDTTHWGTYTGVQPMSLRQMPKVNPDDKSAILGIASDALASPPSRLADACSGALPLFWQERKPQGFWRQLLLDLDIKAVCDMTPGSGTLAASCMQEGVAYFGITRTAAHSSYLQNKLDRDALAIISIQGSALYEADMAEHIKAHFADIVEEFNAADVDDADTEEEQLDDDQ